MPRNRIYTEAQLAKMRAVSSAWQKENRERMRQIHAKHKRTHAASIRVKRAAYLRANREKKNATAKAWRAANPTKMKQYRANRNRKCPNHGTLSENKRRAVKKSTPVGNVKLIERWMTSWKAKPLAVCFWCQDKHPSKSCHADHIIPLSKGGKHAVENLCIACSSCNHRKASRTMEAWNGLLASPVLL